MSLFIKQTHIDRKQIYVQQGGKAGRDKLGVWDQQIQTSIIKQINSKALRYSTGNYIIQYLVINYNVKLSGKEYTYIYIHTHIFMYISYEYYICMCTHIDK